MTTSAFSGRCGGQPGWLCCCAAQLGAMAVAWVVVAAIAQAVGGPAGFGAASLAAGICLASGIAAFGLSGLVRGPSLALAAVVLGMLVRMGVPLGLGGILHWQSAALAEAGLLWYVAAFYVVTLVVDTSLSVARIRATLPCGASRSVPPPAARVS